MSSFEARALWRGSTGAGWDGYDRAHEVTVPPAEQALTVIAMLAERRPPHRSRAGAANH